MYYKFVEALDDNQTFSIEEDEDLDHTWHMGISSVDDNDEIIQDINNSKKSQALLIYDLIIWCLAIYSCIYKSNNMFKIFI